MRGSQWLQLGLVGFLVGVFVESYFGVPSWIFFLLAAGGVAVSAFESRKTLLPTALCLLLFSGGVFFMRSEMDFWAALPEQALFEGSVEILSIDEPKIFFRPVTMAATGCEELCFGTKILWRAPVAFEAEPGDRYTFRCTLERPENFDPDFDYRSYLAGQGIGFVCSERAEFSLTEKPEYSWRRELSSLRGKVEMVLRQALPEPEAGLALGLILGGNDYLSRETKDVFSRTGLSHIVAVSGFNMTVLVQFAVIVGLLAGLWRRYALIVAASLIVLFLLLIGAPASALRAALMTGTAFLAYFFGRLPTSANSLLLAASLMLVGNPLLLRFDVGFQLSFLATLALIVSGPLIEKLLPLRQWWGKALAIPFYTALIELFTLPVLFGAFGQANILAPLSNFFILPLVPITMIYILLILPFLFLAPFSALALSFPLWMLLAAQVRLAEWFDRFSFGLVQYNGLTFFVAFAWYAILVLAFFILKHWRQAYVFRLDH